MKDVDKQLNVNVSSLVVRDIVKRVLLGIVLTLLLSGTLMAGSGDNAASIPADNNNQAGELENQTSLTASLLGLVESILNDLLGFSIGEEEPEEPESPVFDDGSSPGSGQKPMARDDGSDSKDL